MDIWDFDSIQSIWMARKLRDEGTCLDGRVVKANPSNRRRHRLCFFTKVPAEIRTEKKMNAGAIFPAQFDFRPRFEEYLEALDQRSVLRKVPFWRALHLSKASNGAIPSNPAKHRHT